MSVRRPFQLASLAVSVLSAVALIAAASRPARAQGAWPVISEEERTMTDCPQQPGATALWLFREVVTDHAAFEIRIYKRMKILTAAGRDRANIEIPYYAGRQVVSGLEVRLVPPQGPPQPFTGQVFDKTAIRYRRYRIGLKSFAVPDVKPGSIIEFRYKLVPDEDASSGNEEDLAESLQVAGKPEEGGLPKNKEFLSFPATRWELQDDLFTLRARYEYISYPRIGLFFDGPCRISWVSHKLVHAQPVIKGSRVELELSNVPAFEEEEFMTSPEAEQMSVDIFYLDRRITESEEFWRRESEVWQKAVERFIGEPGKVAAKAREMAGEEGNPATRLRKIYDGVQALRNLSYEKRLTRKQMKEQRIKSNHGVSDVLERGYGVRSDLTRTFVALARAAGFEAEAVRVSNRDDKLFRINLLSFYDQMDSEAAMVKLGDRTLLFDPATPFCPFGLVHWSRSNAAALRRSDAPPAFFTTTVYDPDLALTQREVALKLDAAGALTGTVRTTYTGHEALVRRLEHLRDDAEARKKDFERELADILPAGAAVTLTGLEHAEDSTPALVVRYDVSIPGLATAAGDKVLLPVFPLGGAGRYPFRHSERHYPVYFPYPFREFDDIRIELPAGFVPEVRPAAHKTQDDFSDYSLACADEGNGKLHVQRDLTIRKSYFAVDQYAAVKSFYEAARAADGEQIVLTRVKK